MSSDDNGQDLSNYNFAADGFKTAAGGGVGGVHGGADVYMATGGMRGGVDWMRKMAFRFRKIKDNYKMYQHNFGDLLGSPRREKWQETCQELEAHTDVSKLVSI